MNFLQLEYFLEICKYKSISKAAVRLYISQPALSQQLIHLEKELDTQLFHRRGNTMILTDTGERFRASAQKMLFEYRNVQSALKALKEDGSENGAGRLSIAVTKTKSFLVLPYLLPGFRQERPEIEIDIMEVDTGGVEELVANGSVDLGFCYNQYGQPNAPAQPIHYEKICEEQILLALPPKNGLHGAAGPMEQARPSIRFEEFCDRPFIVGKTGFLRSFAIELFHAHGKEIKVALETANPGLAHLLVLANGGCAFVGAVSSFTEPLHVARPVYCTLDPPVYQNVYIGYHQQKYVTRPMRYFIEYAKRAMNAAPFQGW